MAPVTLLMRGGGAGVRGGEEERTLDALLEEREFGCEGIADVLPVGQDDVGGELEPVQADAGEVGGGVAVHGCSFPSSSSSWVAAPAACGIAPLGPACVPRGCAGD